jgi:hypothetical protein
MDVKTQIHFNMFLIYTLLHSPPPLPVGQGLLIIEASRSHRHSTLGKTLLDKYTTLYLQLNSVPITNSNNQVRTHNFSVVGGGGGLTLKLYIIHV